MPEAKPNRGLGRGLSALMADADLIPNDKPAQRQTLPIEKITANSEQPRRSFAPELLQELADSLRSRGVLQPLIVRPHPKDPGLYQIVAGERRWRAAQMAQLHEVPVIVRDLNDTEVLEVAIIENIQRADLNAIEEAMAYRQLMERFGHTQERLGEALNKSRSHIANLMRLLTLPEQVQGWVRDGKLTAGHARAVITAKDPTDLARKVIDRNLSVRETENLARGNADPAPKVRPIPDEKDADTRALEADLSAQLKMRVSINHSGMDGGQVVVTYRDLEQLDRLCQLLASEA
ncbi:ParB/RepB/Spo0J family partition protein [Paracoccus pacificus]|uniref:ParB/RepB/Spo0J family partition protein n=1 Tax=Paracoccus pacificus TaxID=1463598 RepID=A0ABW4R4A1_9RHOB